MTQKSWHNSLLNKSWFYLLIAILVGGILRLYQLGTIPYGYTWDEAAITYDAWGIADWHRDQWAEFMPLTFKSFGDYKAPVMIYLLATTFLATGVQEITIRLVSALAGIVLIGITYLLAKELLPKYGWVAPISAMLVAISPWNVHMSRVGFEANLATTLLAMSVWLFLVAKRFPWAYVLSAAAFAVTFYSYQSTKIVVPLLLVLLIWYQWKDVVKNKVWSGLSFIVLGLGILPLLLDFSGGGGERARQALIVFNDAGKFALGGATLTSIFKNGIHHLLPDYWVLGIQENLRHIVPGFGIVFWLTLGFLVTGLILLLKKQRKLGLFLLGWILIAMLPSILSKVSPHGLRSATMMPALQLAAAFGVVAGFEYLRKRVSLSVYRISIIGVVIIYTINLGLFVSTYYTSYATDSALDYQYGYKQAIEVVKKEGKTADKIVITDAYGQAYIYTLLYLGYTPEQFHQGALANVIFSPVDLEQAEDDRLYVGTPEEISPDDSQVIQIITIPNTDTPVFVIART